MYAFPGHSLSMRGIMKVVDDPSIVKLEASNDISPSGNLKNGVIEVGKTPRVVRVHFSGIDSGGPLQLDYRIQLPF